MTAEEIAVKKQLEEVISERETAFEKNVVKPFVAKSIEGLATTKDFESVNSMLEGLKEDNTKLSEGQVKLQKAFEEKILNAQNQYGSNEAIQKSQGQIINEFISKFNEKNGTSEKKYDNLEEILHRQKSIELPVQKAVQSLSSVGANVITPNRTRPDIIHAPFAPFHMSDLVDRGATTNVNTISYTVESSYTDGTALTAEGAVFADTNQELQEVVDTIRKVATREIFTSEILRNVPRLLTYLLPKMLEKLEIYKDSQILFGTNTGTPAQMRGLFLDAQAFAYSAGTMGSLVAMPNLLDVIVKGSLLATNIYHQPNAVLLNPIDWSDVLLAKSTTGEYVIEDGMIITDRLNIQLIKSPIIPRNQALIGAFNTGAELVTQMAPTIEFSEHEKFSEDKIVARIKTECQMQIVQPQSFVKIPSITSAITAITKP
jgi:HK97 family phage major capsid protein